MIHSLLSLTFSNALGALALGGWRRIVVTRFVRTPALAHALWILVLLKLISPALVELPVRLPADRPCCSRCGLRVRRRTAKCRGGMLRVSERRGHGWAGLSETGDSPRRRIEPPYSRRVRRIRTAFL